MYNLIIYITIVMYGQLPAVEVLTPFETLEECEAAAATNEHQDRLAEAVEQYNPNFTVKHPILTLCKEKI